MRRSNLDLNVPFHSIRQAAHMTGLSEYYLRQLREDNKLPGVWCGRDFRVDVPTLLKLVKAPPQ